MTLARALCAAIGLAATGCLAIYEGTPLELPPRTERGSEPARLVVGVREPRIRLDERGLHAYASEAAALRAAELVEALRATGRFSRVDFERQLPCPPDLVLFAIRNPNDPHYDHNHALLYLALGLIPVIDPYDRGHYFVRVDRKDRRYLFPWSRVEVFWWLSAPLAVLPGWHWRSAPADSSESFAKFIDANWGELVSGVRPAMDEKCAAG
ncbi:MAG: hypothetical protein ACHQ6T_01475 [Myxococcota bacterium]